MIVSRPLRIRGTICRLPPPAINKNGHLNLATFANKRKVDEVIGPLSQKYADAKDEVHAV